MVACALPFPEKAAVSLHLATSANKASCFLFRIYRQSPQIPHPTGLEGHWPLMRYLSASGNMWFFELSQENVKMWSTTLTEQRGRRLPALFRCALIFFLKFQHLWCFPIAHPQKTTRLNIRGYFNRSALVSDSFGTSLVTSRRKSLGRSHNFQRSLRKRASKNKDEARRPCSLLPPQGVTEAFWVVSGTFVCRKEYTWGQILLVSVPENVSNTPFFW